MEIVEPFAPDDLEAACLALKRRDVAFPPSAGQIYTECNRAAANRVEKLRANAPRLPRPEYPSAHRERMKEKFEALLEELRSGVSYDDKYGYRGNAK